MRNREISVQLLFSKRFRFEDTVSKNNDTIKSDRRIKKENSVAKTKSKKDRIIDMLYLLAMAGLALWYAYTKGWIAADFQSIDARQAKTLIERDANLTVIDVRTPEEYKAGHLRGAKLFPLQTLEQRMAELAPYKRTKLLVYCRSGNRSVAASRILKAHGFTPINVKGGIAALYAQNVPIVR
jgi:rhodanese-related sulfurtransferase